VDAERIGQSRAPTAEGATVEVLAEGQVAIVAGALDIRKVPSASDRFMFRPSMLFGVWKEGDQRDWEATRAWAKSLRPQLTV
jgi:hypothetical protein